MANHSATSSDFSYDVFLGYFNGGVCNAFIDRLYQALLEKGINTFRDGVTRPAFEEIEKSRLSMLVLCEKYASSIECLDEIVKISDYIDNKRKQVTVIFYKVEPSEVRKQKDSYEAAMDEHEKRNGQDPEKIEVWRKALTRVCDISGGSIKIEGIMLHPPTHEEIDNWSNTAFKKMKNLRILIVWNAKFSTGPSYLPNSLRLLDWTGFPSQSFPPEFYPERIVDFKLSHSPLIFAELLQIFKDLTFINLSQCQSITQIPNLSGAKNLRVLTLHRCHKLEGFDKSIGLYMSNLVYLSASECTMLKSFVPKMYFPSLEVLSFNFCTRLEHFPDVMRRMDKPLKIHLINTAIKEFPESIGKLTGLDCGDGSYLFDVSEDTPLFWARGKFPIVALTFVFGEMKMDRSEFFPGVVSAESHKVVLHLFIDNKEICHKDYHCCSVGEHHVLLCDLRVLFNKEEWQGLDACIGDDWKAVQVQCESHLAMSHWGVYVYKQKTNMDNILFSFPNSTDPMSSSSLVPNKTPHIQHLDLVEAFGQYLHTFKLEQFASVANELLRWWRNTDAGVSEEASALVYGTSLMQEHEEFVWHVSRILEMLMEITPKRIDDSKFQSAGQLVVELLMARAQPMKKKGHETLHINVSMPIILEECEYHPCTDLTKAPRGRYWGSVVLELEEGDPLVWRIWKSKKAIGKRVSVVLSKCQLASTEGASTSGHGEILEEEFKDPALEKLMRGIEQDAMSLNKSLGKLKATIVPRDVPVSDKYMMETTIIRAQERLGRLGPNFKKTPYGKLRVEHDSQGTIHMQHELGVEHDAQSSTQNKLGPTKILIRWIQSICTPK
ncbi:Toll/interleukin-1 receptor-like proteiny [Sesbania bispinosa]|nr:Toll/interleukin-1 receptor-like proteiny [Sesbania bispinosa]